MSRFRVFLLDGLSLLLEPDARNAVVGDLEELNLGSLRSLFELCGVIARQQARLWNKWQPWLALLGVVGLVGVPVNFLAGSLSFVPWMNIRTYRTYGTGYHRGLTANEEIIIWLSLAVAVMLWSWAAGFAFTSLSRKTAPVTGALLCFAWLCWNASLLGRNLSVLPWFLVFVWLIPSMLFFLPAVWGARLAFRRGDLSSQQGMILLMVTIGVIALATWTSSWPQAALEKWSEGAMHGGMAWHRRLLSYALLSWPTAWIIASSGHHGNTLPLRSNSRRLER